MSVLRCGFGVCLWLAVAVSPLHAALYCVSGLSGLQTVLNSAGTNGQDDEFRFRSGTFLLGQQLFLYVTDGHNVTLSGGWGAACSTPDGGDTTLDGQSSVGILFVDAGSGANVTVRQFTFQGANNNFDNGGALYILAAGNVSVERSLFFANLDTRHGGALVAVAYQTLSIRNNLFFANQAVDDGAMALTGYGTDAYVNSNTVVANSATGMSAYGGVKLSGTAHFSLANNLLWGNSGADVNNTGAATLLNNDYDSVVGNAPDAGSQNNLSVVPIYASGLFNFHLSSHSALVNAGLDNPPGGMTAVDLDGNPRVQLPHVDIGAYEGDFVFYDGFD